MSTDFAVPVQNLIKTWSRGSKLTKRFGKSASPVSAEEALYIAESVERLHAALERQSYAVEIVYKSCLDLCGEPFVRALVEDKSIQSQLKELWADLMDQINEIQDVADEPQDFAVDIFAGVQTVSEDISSRCIRVLGDLRDVLTQAEFPLPPEQPERQAALASVEVLHAKSISIDASNPTPAAPLEITIPTVKDDFDPSLTTQISWAIDSPLTSGPPSDSPTTSSHRHSDPLSVSTNNSDDFISTTAVEISFKSNKDFLERRNLARLTFQNEFRNSIISSEGDSETNIYNNGSSLFPPTDARHVDGRLSKASSNDYAAYLSGRRGHFTSLEKKRQSASSSHSTTGTTPKDRYSMSSQQPPPEDGIFSPTSDASSCSHLNPLEEKRQSIGSSQSMTGINAKDRYSVSSQQPSPVDDFFGPDSPTSVASSSRDSFALAATLKIPGYGQGVEDGLEAIEPLTLDPEEEKSPLTVDDEVQTNDATVDREEEKSPIMADCDEKIFVSCEQLTSRDASTSSMRSIDSPLRHDSSFYKFGGFCPGAATVMRGELGYKIVTRPRGTYGSQDFAKCIKCSFEVSMGQIEKDLRMDVSGIYGSSGIRWRQQFLTKCHVKTSTADEPLYACVFCAEDHKTTEEHDATVFFSYSQLFQHLAKHPRPLTNVAGINILYGRIDPSIRNFDLHFIDTEATPSIYNMKEIAPLVAVRASGYAIATHHPKHSVTSFKDPDGNSTLHFAAGARIVGITFPDHFGGAWCQGFHDGEKGSFPTAAVALDLPATEEFFMSPPKSQIAVVKWDFKPRNAKVGGWLKLSRGEKITQISYTFADQWCWSGQTKNGKWGLFPSAFVEEIHEVAEGPLSPPVPKGLMAFRKFGTRSAKDPLSRTARSPSIRSGSSGRVGSIKTLAGLEWAMV